MRTGNRFQFEIFQDSIEIIDKKIEIFETEQQFQIRYDANS